MTIPVSVRVNAIAERFHIDCHMFCLLLGQDPNAVSDSALECFGRGNNLLWPTGAPSLIFVCEFVHYVPTRRKNAISILSAYSNNFAAFWPFRPPGTSIGVDLTLGHFKQLSREPRRIEI